MTMLLLCVKTFVVQQTGWPSNIVICADNPHRLNTTSTDSRHFRLNKVMSVLLHIPCVMQFILPTTEIAVFLMTCRSLNKLQRFQWQ